MTQDEYEVGSLENAEKFAIIRMAREAGLEFETNLDGSLYGMVSRSLNEELFKFASLIADYEREACAKVCEELQTVNPAWVDMNYAEQCAAAIRSRCSQGSRSEK